MKRITVAMLVALLMSTAHASPLPDYPFVFASGVAEERLAPDECVVSYAISVRDKDSDKAMQVVEKRSAETLALLVKHEVKRTDITASEVDKERVRDRGEQDRLEFLGYETTRRFRFTLLDLEKYASLVDALLKAADVTDVRTEFDRTDRKEIDSRLTTQAVLDARAKADLMAAAAGQRIVRLRAISQRGFENLGIDFGVGNRDTMGRVSGFSLSESLFVPSTIEFQNTVSVIYEVEEKQ
jgi:uncharacterized protein